jgi:ATP-dependent helicase/nuclease subunit A
VAKLLPFLPLFDEPPDELPEDPQTAQSAELQPISPLAARTPDAEARAKALDIRRSFIVEAPAGSGKTGLLIQRFLKLLTDDSVTSPEQVLAITFTLKATAEMRDRVLAHLEAARLNPDAEELPKPSDFVAQTRTLAHAVLKRDRALGWDLLDHPHRLNLRTIDSVCAEIARTLPVLSGSGGRLTPAKDAQPLYRDAARRTLLLLGGSHADAAFDAALRDLLLHRDGNLADCETLLADMLSLRDQWGTLIPLTHPQLDDAWLDANVLPRLQLALEQAVCAELTVLVDSFPADSLEDLAALAAEMAHSDGYNGRPSPIAICKDRGRSPASDADDLDHWRSLIHLLVKPSKPRGWRKGLARNVVGFEIEKHHDAQLKSLIARLSGAPGLVDILCRIESLPDAKYPAAQWALAKSLFRVLGRALVELQLLFAERGECDFTELSLLAQSALRTDAGADDLAAALGARLQHLLVDEMQDTSAGQYDLIQSLTASWDGYSQTVFLVGDPRQSIYLFRQARVERFLDTMRTQRLGDLPLIRLLLTANFRSQETLVEQFNRDFSLVFPDAALGGTNQSSALPYTSAEPTVPASPYAAGLTWHANPLGVSQTALPHGRTAAQIRQRQARRDAREIRRLARHWLDKPLPATRKTTRDEAGQAVPEPWRIAVLVRSRNHLAEIVAEFDTERFGRIPYRAVEITPLNERQEILDLTALTRALLHPADRIAWLAILRAPWCGLPLADLHILAGTDDPTLKDLSIQRLIAERGHLLAEESCLRLERLWTVMSEATKRRAHLSAAQLVERAWRSLGGEAWLAEDERINARRYFQLLDEIEASGGPIDPVLLETRLQRLYAEPSAIPAGTPFVELLTIHKAKGLEWDVVFVPALERSPGINRGRLLTWSEVDIVDESSGGAAPILLAPIAARGEEIDALTAWIKGIYREREAAERKRLFYVASTRAREEVHLFAAPDLSASGEIKPRWDSLLKAAWPAAQPHFTPTTAVGGERGLDSETSAPPRPIVLDLAASVAPLTPNTPFVRANAESSEAAYPMLQRLPLTFSAMDQFIAARADRLPYAEPEPFSDTAQFTRPEGSFAARIFGTAVHALLEILTNRLAAGVAPNSLLAELQRWTPRISAVLRAEGLPPAAVDQTAARVRGALEATLRDRNGLWLLSPHPNAATEFALTALDQTNSASTHLASVRIDRIFHAGSEPHAPGDECLWIVDYKTSSHGPTGLDEFLAAERATYAPQLETYARILMQTGANARAEVRLALYYPALPRFLWWPFQPGE